MNFKKTGRSKINRVPSRGYYDKKTIYQIIDESKYCHISFIQGKQPFIIPTIHARIKDRLFFHGSKTSRLLNHIANGNQVCIAMTIVDGFVLARSVVHHSMNYRSVILFGKGERIKDSKMKLEAFKAMSNHLLPGRWEDARQPNEREINSTAVVAVKIDEASAKIRTGPPLDEEEDYKLSVWAGVLPVSKGFDKPVRDPKLKSRISLPGYIKNYLLKNSNS
jgi:uncharacterized protein